MVKMYYDKNADIKLLKGKKIVILGYGSQGHAQALNLRDSGLKVSVVEKKGTRGFNLAITHGWKEGENLFTSVPETVRGADWIQFLLPDELQAIIWKNDVAPNIKKGVVLGFSHGFNIRYGQIVPPKEADVVLIAPKGPGHLVRRTYEEGKGTPALVAVEQDYSKKALKLGLAYCRGIGATRAGVLQTTFKEETETDLFGEQNVLCGGVVDLVKAGYETLVEAGYQPEVAYFECLHELKLIVDLVQEGGIGWMNYSISDTAEYGEYTRGPRLVTEQTKLQMKKNLEEVQSGQFAKEYLLENLVGRPVFNSARKAMSEHSIEIVGERLRSMMPWLRKKE
ncbi:MAG TPA: ketol-acid reductoisomerase [Elusimicrobiota bacterium]|nr:ketol-acid reductoisomerase [Elusimicrobiota bacterium]